MAGTAGQPRDRVPLPLSREGARLDRLRKKGPTPASLIIGSSSWVEETLRKDTALKLENEGLQVHATDRSTASATPGAGQKLDGIVRKLRPVVVFTVASTRRHLSDASQELKWAKGYLDPLVRHVAVAPEREVEGFAAQLAQETGLIVEDQGWGLDETPVDPIRRVIQLAAFEKEWV